MSFNVEIAIAHAPGGCRYLPSAASVAVISSSLQQLQIRHDVLLILLGHEDAARLEYEGVVAHDVFERLRRIVVEVRRGLRDAPERGDLEGVQALEVVRVAGDQGAARVGARDARGRAIRIREDEI